MGLGIGLVFCVIRDVKSVIFPTTLLEKVAMPLVMEAANSPPGSWGREGRLVFDPPDRGATVRALVPELRVAAYVGS